MQRQEHLFTTKTFLSFPTDKNTLQNYFLSVCCGLFPHPEAPFIFSLKIADCSSLKLFNPTLIVDSVPQGSQVPLSQPSQDHSHCTDTSTEVFTFLQTYFSTLAKPADMIPFFLQKRKMRIQIYFRVTGKLQSRELKEIIAILNFNIHPMH